MKIKIATRKSKLAQVQTEIIMDLLNKKFGAQCEKLLMETLGDKILDRTLDKIGGKGLFVKEIEMALLEDKAQAAVHSMKDVPYEVLEEFELAAMPMREDPRDAFISMNGVHFKDLKQGARIGTSSKRRASQLKILRPDLEIVPIRGNVQTRIAKIEKDSLDGIILAAAGLIRLGMESIITDYMDVRDMVPAIGQGALGVEIKAGSQHAEAFRSLDDRDVRICVEAERSFMRELKGDCHSTIGAYAVLEGEEMHMTGIFEVGGKLVKKDIRGKAEDYEKLGIALAKKIVE